MLNKIDKFFPSRRLPISFLGLLLTLGVVGEQTRPVLSNEIEEQPTSAALATDLRESTNQSQNRTETSLLSQLREVREQRSQQQTAFIDSETFVNQNQQENLQQQPKLVSSATLSKNVKVASSTTEQKAAKEAGVRPRVNIPTKDGIYLYGQSPQPNQLGQGYVLFERQQSKVTGALYMPQSEFSCFEGTLDKSGELAMTVTGSPDESGSNEVATANRLPDFSGDEPVTYAYSVALQDYHQLNTISANDRRILQMCSQSANDVYTKLVK
ncbi:hypothetical protein JYQ62_14490 [Nostoc sp. UHCC 0702]|nr:hypothetical protein JYQ62_14490 [Nostoc sp. UHCC 0702]